MTPQTASGPTGRLGTLSNEIKELRERLRRGGGPDRVDAQHEAGKLTARERIELLLDSAAPLFELGLLVGHDDAGDAAPAAGVVTCVGRVHGREVVVVANDATVHGGAWSARTVAKILRAQEVAMRCHLPIVYLVDSAQAEGAALGDDGFGGRFGVGRVLYHAAVMRHDVGTPQLAAVMGPCSGSAAYLAVLADVTVMVDGTSFLALGGPETVRRTTGRDVAAEELGGSRAQTGVSGVAHYRAESDSACLERLRQQLGELPDDRHRPLDRVATPPVRLAYELYDLMPDDPRQPYDVRAVLECLLDGEPLDEFQPEHAPEMICGTGYLEGVRIGLVANARGLLGSAHDDRPRLGGLVYAESARKVAFFIETMNRHGTPLVFVQDVAGFTVGPDAEHGGLLRAGAELVEAMATVRVPRITVTLNHAVGAGYHALAGQGFDPDFTICLPTGRLGGGVDDTAIDACQAAARGFVDEILLPEELRPALGLLLRAALRAPGSHETPFRLP